MEKINPIERKIPPPGKITFEKFLAWADEEPLPDELEVLQQLGVLGGS